jgi:multidrug resistance efflux pump
VIPPGPVIVSTMIEGRVQSLTALEGQTIEAGREIARLDDALYRQEAEVRKSAVALVRARLARLEAGFRPEEIQQAKADLDQAQAKLRQAQTDHERIESLLPSGAIAGKTYTQAKAALEAAQADVASRRAEFELRQRGTRKEDIAVARADLAAAEAELARVEWRLNACVIKAPISGVVLERFAQVGDWLVPVGSSRERAAALVSIVDPKRIQAWVDVNQRDIGRVFVGQQVVLSTDAEPNRQVGGRVSLILPKANLQKNTVQVKVEIPDPPTDLRPEMSVKVRFLPQERDKVKQRSRSDE